MLATLYQYRKNRSQVVFEKAAACEFCDFFQNSFSAEHCQTTTSVSNILNHQITNLKLEVYYKITIGCLSEECMDVDCGGGGSLGVISPSPLLSALPFLYLTKILLFY